jgi:hypothetical protein
MMQMKAYTNLAVSYENQGSFVEPITWNENCLKKYHDMHQYDEGSIAYSILSRAWLDRVSGQDGVCDG